MEANLRWRVDLGRPKVNVEKRFFEKVNIIGSCWLWTAQIEKNGYGRFKLDGKKKLAHRVSYELFIGPIPEGLQIDHLCKIRHCVNPEHLEAVTCLENIRRGDTGLYQKIRTNCPQGHEYSIKNTYIRKSGSRMCRMCSKIKIRQWRKIRGECIID